MPLALQLGLMRRLWWAAAAVFGVAALACLGFFRDPERTPPDAPGAVLAPADGRVVTVEKSAHEKRFLQAPAVRVGIFMSPLDVHVNRVPVAGQVTGTSKLCPVISFGCGKPSRNKRVGATSARIPSSQRNFARLGEARQVRVAAADDAAFARAAGSLLERSPVPA